MFLLSTVSPIRKLHYGDLTPLSTSRSSRPVADVFIAFAGVISLVIASSQLNAGNAWRGTIEVVSPEETPPTTTHYQPHHAVVRQESLIRGTYAV